MLLTFTTTRKPATDLGYLLHKNPSRVQAFKLSFGQAPVFYPEATDQRCTAALLLDVDPVALVRGRKGSRPAGFALGRYVSDRPYAASSFLSVAIARVFSESAHLGPALSGYDNATDVIVEGGHIRVVQDARGKYRSACATEGDCSVYFRRAFGRESCPTASARRPHLAESVRRTSRPPL